MTLYWAPCCMSEAGRAESSLCGSHVGFFAAMLTMPAEHCWLLWRSPAVLLPAPHMAGWCTTTSGLTTLPSTSCWMS